MKNIRLTTTPLPFPSTVYTFKTSPCMPAPRAHVENTCTRGAGTHGFFQRVTHNTTTTPHGDRHRERQRQRQRQRQRETEKEDRDNGEEGRMRRTQDNRREKIHFQCGGAWPFFIDGVLFLVNPVCARDFSLLNSVKYDCSLISFSSILFFEIFSFKKTNYLVMQLQFFLQINSAQVFCATTTSKELAPLHSVKNGIFRSACSTSPKMDANLGISALTHTARLTNSLARSLSRMVSKVQWLCCKVHYILGCVLQDMEPPKSSSILRKSSNILKPLRCVKFTKAVARNAEIRNKNPSLGIICPGCSILISATPMPQNLRFGLKKRRKGKSEMPVNKRGKWHDVSWNLRRNIKEHSSHLRWNGVYLRLQQLNQRKENLLWTLVRRCTSQAKKNEFLWIGNRDDLKKSDVGYISQWWSADEWRGHSLCQRIGYIRIQCNTEKFVPIVIPGLLSTTSSSSSTSTSTSPSSQEIDHSDHQPAIESSESVPSLLKHQKSCWINQPKPKNK